MEKKQTNNGARAGGNLTVIQAVSPSDSPQFSPQLNSTAAPPLDLNSQTGVTDGGSDGRDRARSRALTISDKTCCCLRCLPKSITICNKVITRSQYVTYFQYLILATILIIYAVYQGSIFFNPNENRKDWVDIDPNLEYFPLPYFYMNWDISQYMNQISCNVQVRMNGSKLNFDSTRFIMITNENNVFNQSIDYLLSTNQEKWIAINNSVSDDYLSGELLIIPPSRDNGGKIKVENTFDDTFTIIMDCDSSNNNSINSSGASETRIEHIMYGTQIKYDINIRDQLERYESIKDALNELSELSDIMLGGYLIFLEYEWYEFENTVSGSEDNGLLPYFVTNIGGVYNFAQYLEAQTNRSSINNGSNNGDYSYAMYVSIQPHESGIKTIFKTEYLMNILDVMSNIGGLYSSIAGVMAHIFVALIWGFDWKIVIFKGLEPDATDDVSIREANKLEKFMKDYIKYQFKQQFKQMNAEKVVQDEQNKQNEVTRPGPP